jgi:MFS transporter, DHA2 family, multidrug resistance protein
MERELITGSKLGITIAVMCAAMMAVLDISIVNVALNDIRASFGTPIDQIAWVSTGYMMANVVVIPMTGWFQRRFGFRRYFVTSILIFGFASVLCGTAWNLPSLVAFRVLQGLGGGAIIPTAQAILFARYPRNEHGTAQALFGLGAVTAPLLGPSLGGYFVDVASWHWIFLINVPVVIVAAMLAWNHIEEPGWKSKREAVDTRGIALLVIGMATLQYVLEEGHRDNWLESRMITLLSIVAAISLVTFVVHELETPNAVVDFRVFLNRSYAAATGLNFAIGVTLFSATFMFSLYCGAVMHYTALDIGLLFLKGSAIQLVLMPVIGRLLSRVDPRPLILMGGLIVGYSLYLTSTLSNMADERALLLTIFVRACGLGFVFAPLNVTALSDIPAEQRGNAAGLFNLTRELGGSIGTALMSTVLDHNIKEHYTALARNVSLFDNATLDALTQARHYLAQSTSDALSASFGVLAMRISQQALVRAFSQNFSMLAVFYVALLALVGLLRRTSGSQRAPKGAR